jgi:Ni,Fe-hydrogenase maturation factor
MKKSAIGTLKTEKIKNQNYAKVSVHWHPQAEIIEDQREKDKIPTLWRD